MNDIIWKMVLSYNEAVFAGSPDTEAMRAALAAIPITEGMVAVVQRAIAKIDGRCTQQAALAAITAFLADLQKEK